MKNVDPSKVDEMFSEPGKILFNDPFITDCVKINQPNENISQYYMKFKFPLLTTRDLVCEYVTLKLSDTDWYLGMKSIPHDKYPT